MLRWDKKLSIIDRLKLIRWFKRFVYPRRYNNKIIIIIINKLKIHIIVITSTIVTNVIINIIKAIKFVLNVILKSRILWLHFLIKHHR